MGFKCDSGLVLYLPFYELYGSSFMSKDAYGHLCTVTGATWGLQGRVFDGDDHIAVGATGLVQEQGTIILWLKVTTFESHGAPFSTNDNGGNDAIRCEVGFPGAVKQLTLYDTTMGAQFFTVASFDNTWGMLTTAWNATNMIGYSDLYKNFDVARDTTVTTNTLVIGRGFDLSRLLKGVVGEFWGYNRTLSIVEIAHIRAATKWRYR